MHTDRLRLPQAFFATALAASLLAACSSSPPPAPTASAPAAAKSSPATATKAGNDYGKPENWLCRPEHNEACSTDLTASRLLPNGEWARETWAANPKAPVDCFYVYPTVSLDPTPNSDMSPGPEEKRAVQEQLARFGSECRLFAPMYRQITLGGLRAMLSGKPSGVDLKLGYLDVVDAWNHYLKHDNKGRGVILIGHSQGSYVLIDLLKNEIEGKPVQRQLISAYLIGANVGVPKGKDSGGHFQQIPLCRSAGQTGCVISYVSFRENAPPSPASMFGRLKDGNTAACTNPAALSGGRGELHSYLPHKINVVGQPFGNKGWEAFTQKVQTPYVATDMVTAECVEQNGASYLSVAVKPAYAAKGADLPGDLMVGGHIVSDWGTHLVDVDLAMGNLLAIARQQIRNYLKSAS